MCLVCVYVKKKKKEKKVRSHLKYTIELLIITNILFDVRQIFPLIIVAYASPRSFLLHLLLSLFFTLSLSVGLYSISSKPMVLGSKILGTNVLKLQFVICWQTMIKT